MRENISKIIPRHLRHIQNVQSTKKLPATCPKPMTRESIQSTPLYGTSYLHILVLDQQLETQSLVLLQSSVLVPEPVERIQYQILGLGF